MTLEQTILSNLVFNENFLRNTAPYIKAEYFTNYDERKVFTLIEKYFSKYNRSPNPRSLIVDLQNDIDNLDQSLYNDSIKLIKKLEETNSDPEWLLDNTEQFCKNNAVRCAVQQIIHIRNENKLAHPEEQYLQLMKDAISVSFDNDIGHNFIQDFEKRYDFYHKQENHLPFDIDMLNTITEGGLVPKTLNLILAPTGVGKSLVMCHFAASNLMRGKNVLYITLEMAEERIAERIDANLLNIPISELRSTSKETYEGKIQRLKNKTQGQLIIKEYPPVSAGANHFRFLINELRTKKNFVPDVIYIDYLNICMSSRLRHGSNVNSYLYVKSIAEELRGLGVEFNVPIVSASQVNRAGANDSDYDLTNTSDSFGLPMTCDLILALISTPELIALNQICFKQLKNRFSDWTQNNKFIVGIDHSKMRLYNCEKSAQLNPTGDLDIPIMDINKKFDRKLFDEFK